jgi:hypothetical protein
MAGLCAADPMPVDSLEKARGILVVSIHLIANHESISFQIANFKRSWLERADSTALQTLQETATKFPSLRAIRNGEKTF